MFYKRTEARLTLDRFAYAVIAAEEITAVSNTMDFRYDDGRSFLSWPVGQNIDPAVWITLFLALVIVINMFPVKVWPLPESCIVSTRS